MCDLSSVLLEATLILADREGGLLASLAKVRVIFRNQYFIKFNVIPLSKNFSFC